ncbi:winged helix-turn-helix transcriptional regulator [Saccharothrix texasensis]|uniref:winged helix-turn-helix transcriptional regulator n=1 Tax=Saccharothrix texasensis TaxID=103734 RepID=UPI000F4B69D3|nr:winged helix-turn-helix transcriptional regulator [Saccharothrix texasensis]
MATRRRYDDACTVARALDLVGERWALLVVRELLFGPKRFTDLRTGLPGASPNVLSQRLRELDEAGVLRRRRLPPPAAAWVYELTPYGHQLEPVVFALGKWGAQVSGPLDGRPLSVDSMMLAMRTLYDPARTRGVVTDVVVELGEDGFRATATPDGLRLVREPVDRPDVVIRTDTTTLSGVVSGGRTLTEALDSGDLVLVGDDAVATRFFTLFSRERLA